MLTYTALTTLSEKSQAEALGEALEGLEPSPTGVGVFEVEDGKGFWEVGRVGHGCTNQVLQRPVIKPGPPTTIL